MPWLGAGDEMERKQAVTAEARQHRMAKTAVEAMGCN